MGVVQNITPSCPSNYTGGVGDGQPCTVNVTTWTAPTDLNGTIIYKIYLNEMRTAINDEESRRQGTITDFGVAEVTGNPLYTVKWSVIRDALNTLEAWTNTYPGVKSGYKTFTWTYAYPTQGNIITDEMAEEFRSKINDAEDDCLCDCNYCTCNCNYCTCNCNYCTCNCNYCTCNCNYACTCNCNYSDIRLKKNVIYI